MFCTLFRQDASGSSLLLRELQSMRALQLCHRAHVSGLQLVTKSCEGSGVLSRKVGFRRRSSGSGLDV
jgi:hypothetical protein